MCWICSTVTEDWKNRRNLEKSEGHFGETFGTNIFICLFIRPGVSHITVDCLQDF